MPARRSRRFTLPLVVAWSCLATYVVAARVVGNSFPLSTFDMYQAHAPEVVARVVVVDAAGVERELGHYDGYACEPAPLQLGAEVAERCGEQHRPLPYVVRDQQRWLEAHLESGGAGAGAAEAIAIVSRAYVLTEQPGPPAFTDCELARCTAHPRGGAP